MKCVGTFFVVMALVFVGLYVSRRSHFRPPVAITIDGDRQAWADHNRAMHQLKQQAQEMRQQAKELAQRWKHPPAPLTVSAPAAKSGQFVFDTVVVSEPEVELSLAKESAFEKAQTALSSFLNLPGGWQPSIEYIQDHLIRDLRTDNVQVADDGDKPHTDEITINIPGRGGFKAVEEVRKVEGTTMYRIHMHIAATADELRSLQNLAQHDRRGARMIPLARGLGCLVALFAAIGLYIRFDELTRGYYRTALRLGASGLVAVAWVALSWPVIHMLMGG